MQPYTDPVLELRLVVMEAEARAASLLPANATHPQMEDHRTELIGELLEALDRIDRGLGTRLMLAMYPKASAMNQAAAAGERRAA